MSTRIFIGLIVLVSIVACSPDTLQSTYEKEQKYNEMDGFNIIHIEENDRYGLVLATSWTEEYIQNRDKPGISVYEKVEGKWSRNPGISCGDGRGAATLGIPDGNYLYCGVITEERPFVKMAVGETEAQIFDVNDKKRVWYAVEKAMGLKIRGTYESGEQVNLN
jgi:hypothetical protein